MVEPPMLARPHVARQWICDCVRLGTIGRIIRIAELCGQVTLAVRSGFPHVAQRVSLDMLSDMRFLLKEAMVEQQQGQKQM